jgi:hypothetical protein
VLVELRAVRRPEPARRDDVLDQERHPLEGARWRPGREPAVGRFGVRRRRRIQRAHRVEHAVGLVDSRETRGDHIADADLPGPHVGHQLHGAAIGEVGHLGAGRAGGR